MLPCLQPPIEAFEGRLAGTGLSGKGSSGVVARLKLTPMSTLQSLQKVIFQDPCPVNKIEKRMEEDKGYKEKLLRYYNNAITQA